jgi:glycine amidinotransferase
MMKLNSYDEWSPLKEVVVGSPVSYEAQDLELSFKLFFHDVAYKEFWYPSYKSEKKDIGRTKEQTPARHISEKYLRELAEDVNGLVRTLEGLGVKVRRPMTLNNAFKFRTPYWEATTVPALNVRDQAIVIGNEIIETPPQIRARYFENDLLKPIFYHYFSMGARWTVMPRPIMADNSFDISYALGREGNPAIQEVYKQAPSEFDVGFEMMIDAAQCIRFGKDIMVNVANENHEKGYQWLQMHLGDTFRLHKVYRLTDSHVDSIILPLKPGKLLLRAPKFRDQLPAPLRKWDVIYPPEPSENIFPQYEESELILTSKYIDLNVLSVDENKVLVNSAFPELAKVLESNGFTPIMVQHRHRRLFGGGFHCFTLDTVREGQLEDYFS